MILDGKLVAEKIQQQITQAVLQCKEITPHLAVILVGENPASSIYVKRKAKACSETGIQSTIIKLPADISEQHLLNHIDRLNKDPAVHGILVQLPLPKQINPSLVLRAVDPQKDVDGFHPINIGKMVAGDTDAFFPCTPWGIQVLLEKSGIDVQGLNALIIGRSSIVGRPLAILLAQNRAGANATVTLAHSKTKDIKSLALKSDLIVAAMGRPHFVTEDMVPKGCIVVDVGINKIADPQSEKGYRIVGDVDFKNVKEKCAFITPVPGGVGPMTIAMLLANTLKGFELSQKGV